MESVTQRVVDTDNGARESVTHGVESVTQRVADTGNGERESDTQGVESTEMRWERKRHPKGVESTETGERVPLRAWNVWLHARVPPESHWLVCRNDRYGMGVDGWVVFDWQKVATASDYWKLTALLSRIGLCTGKSYHATELGAESIKLLALWVLLRTFLNSRLPLEWSACHWGIVMIIHGIEDIPLLLVGVSASACVARTMSSSVNLHLLHKCTLLLYCSMCRYADLFMHQKNTWRVDYKTNRHFFRSFWGGQSE